MRIVIIGTSGQLATELRERVWRPGLHLVPHERVDITQRDQLFSSLARRAPDLIINASAYTAVDRAETERGPAFAVNADGPRLLAEWCADAGVPLIHVSTDYVFDGLKVDDYTEEDPPNPLGVYGESKLAGEVAIRSLLDRHVIIRTSWLFGKHGANFVKTILRLVREGRALRVIADQHGRPTGVAPLAEAIERIAHATREGRVKFGTFHYAGAGTTTWHGFAEAIVSEQAALTGQEPKVTAIATSEYPVAAKRPARSVLSTAAFESEYGPVESWRIALSKVVADCVRGHG